MTEQQQILVGVLAECDAAFLPLRQRQWNTKAPANVYFGRKHFLEAGIPWRVGGSGVAERMAGGRLLETMAEAGLLVVKRVKSVRWLHVRLTAEAEAEARALVGLPDLNSALALTAELDRLTAGEPSRQSRRWVSEYVLAAPVLSTRDLMAVEDKALPALWRGWLDVWSDLNGHARYHLEQAGVDALAEADRATPKGESPPRDSEAVHLYYDTIKHAVLRLEKATPDHVGEIGRLPLIASGPDDIVPDAAECARINALATAAQKG